MCCCSKPRRSKKSSRRPTSTLATAEKKRVEISQSTIQQKFRSLIREQTMKSWPNVLSEPSEINAAILTILLMQRSFNTSLCTSKLHNRLDLHQARAEIVSAERWCFFSVVYRLYFDLPISGISKTQQLDSIFVSYRSADVYCITIEAIDVKAYYKLISPCRYYE